MLSRGSGGTAFAPPDGSKSASRSILTSIRLFRACFALVPRLFRFESHVAADSQMSVNEQGTTRSIVCDAGDVNDPAAEIFNASSGLRSTQFDHAKRVIDTSCDCIARSARHSRSNKVLYEGRNANRKQELS
ncbi:hypothetical protein [Paraburkholderia sp.]|uniref:hypothetical protein n=1 Tax=Paraburkholderia sp. TaxID=1926495 RepID=UPI003D6DC714